MQSNANQTTLPFMNNHFNAAESTAPLSNRNQSIVSFGGENNQSEEGGEIHHETGMQRSAFKRANTAKPQSMPVVNPKDLSNDELEYIIKTG